jgi:hypothetical protein
MLRMRIWPEPNEIALLDYKVVWLLLTVVFLHLLNNQFAIYVPRRYPYADTKAGSTISAMPAGRPSTYTEAVGQLIARKMADGWSIRRCCRELPDCPKDHHTVLDWEDNIPEFASQITHARARQGDFWVEKGNEIIDTIKDSESAQVARVQLDWLKWTAGKQNPKRYGDKLDMNVTGELSLASRLKEARQNAERARK